MSKGNPKMSFRVEPALEDRIVKECGRLDVDKTYFLKGLVNNYFTGSTEELRNDERNDERSERCFNRNI